MKLITSFTFAVICCLSTCRALEIDFNETLKNIFGTLGGEYPTPPADEDCTCVPLSQCQTNDVAGSKSSCSSDAEVCCKHPLNQSSRPDPSTFINGCGKRKLRSVFRISGPMNNEAGLGEFPWMVAIFEEGQYICGGSLIHQHFVLTAAHNVYRKDPNSLKLRAGEWDLTVENNEFPHQERSVDKVIIHEKFVGDHLFNDIALLITDVPFVLTEHVNIICQPKQDEVILDKSCEVSGWGKDSLGKGQAMLKKAELPIVGKAECQKRIRQDSTHKRFTLHESFICAGGQPGIDTCKGDGGSPLVCPIQGNIEQYQQVGVVSWGLKCGSETPGVYASTAKFSNWINDHIYSTTFRHCGKRHLKPENLNSSDKEANIGEFPWMVAIFEEGQYICGGSLIHNSVVLTAAHCLYKKDLNSLKLRAGEWDLKTKNIDYPYQERSVDKVIIHERFHTIHLFNDIALLITDVPFVLTEHINIICLPKQNEVILDSNCFASGWGKDPLVGERPTSNILKKAELPLIGRVECQKRIREDSSVKTFMLHDSFICGGGRAGMDTRKGDGGSPLVCRLPGSREQYQQVGIVSWGLKSGAGTPGAYVNAARFRRWIDTKMSILQYKAEY